MSIKPKLKINLMIRGASLMELLAVLCILGILAYASFVAFEPTISKAYSMEAEQHLDHLFTLEKTYFYMHSKYSNDLKEIGFEGNKTVKEGGNAKYTYEILEAGNNRFRARATAAEDFDGDGIINVWEVNQDKQLKEITPD
jgi:type IV pilus assembly protein PilE